MVLGLCSILSPKDTCATCIKCVLNYALKWNRYLNTIFLKNFQPIWTCFGNFIRKIEKKKTFLLLVLKNGSAAKMESWRRVIFCRIVKALPRRVREIFLTLCFLIFVLKERWKRDPLLGKQKPCHRAVYLLRYVLISLKWLTTVSNYALNKNFFGNKKIFLVKLAKLSQKSQDVKIRKGLFCLVLTLIWVVVGFFA